MPVTVPTKYVPAMQSDATYSGVAVQNIWNPVLAATKNVRLINILFSMAVANEDLEVRIIVDGITYTVSQTAVAGTIYQIDRWGATTTANGLYASTTTSGQTYISFLIEGRSVSVDIRKTSANGANTLSCRVVYEKW